MAKKLTFKFFPLTVAFLLTSSCGQESLNLFDDTQNQTSAEFSISGKVSDENFFGGEILALSGSGSLSAFDIGLDGAFAIDLFGNDIFSFHFVANGAGEDSKESDSPFFAQTTAEPLQLAPALLRFEENPFDTRLTEKLDLRHAISSSLNVGGVTIDGASAFVENNPLEQLDSDLDSVNDYFDEDANNNSIPDDAEEEGSIDARILAEELPLIVAEISPSMNSLDVDPEGKVVIQFSEPIKNTQSNWEKIRVTNENAQEIGLEFSLEDEGYRVVIKPKDSFSVGQKHSLKIASTIQSELNDQMIGDFSSWFAVEGAEQSKVSICHIEKRNEDEKQTNIEVNENAVQAHLNHGDFLGECPSENAKKIEKGENFSLISIEPEHNDDQVDLDEEISAKFSKKIKRDSIEFSRESFFVEDQNGEAVLGSLKLSDSLKKIIFVPKKDFASGQMYKVHLGEGITSIDDEALKSALTLEFFTEVEDDESEDDDDQEEEDDDNDNQENDDSDDDEDEVESDDD